MIFLQLEKLQKRDQIEKTTMAPSKTSDVELNLSYKTKKKRVPQANYQCTWEKSG
jgi:hypothetical protein